MFIQLEYPILYSEDVQACATFYQQALGFKVHAGSSDFVELVLGDSKLALNSADGRTKLAGHQTIVVKSDDIVMDRARLAERFPNVGELVDPGYGRTFDVRDPAGNKIEVIEEA